MKKTLIIALSVGLSTLAMADAIQYTGTTNTGTGGPQFTNSNNGPGAYAVDFSKCVTFTLANSEAVITEPFSAYLTSISLKVSASTSIQSGMVAPSSGAKVAVYTLGSIDGSSKDFTLSSFLGLSDFTTFTTTGQDIDDVTSDTTFTFKAPVKVDSAGKYAFVFVKDSVTASALEDVESVETLRSAGSLEYVRLVHTWGLDTNDCAEILGNKDHSLKTGERPVVTYNLSSVPEPATATLSLLALAGIAARRRRK